MTAGDTRTPPDPPAHRAARLAPWLGTAARLGLAALWLAAGLSKVGDLAASGRAVHAYQLLPYDLAMAAGAAMPFIEIVLGLLLLAGAATRLAAAVSAGLLAVFATGVASAWARGLAIDCGCFGGGGELMAGAEPTYGWELTRNGLLLLVSVYLLIRPHTRWSVDARWSG